LIALEWSPSSAYTSANASRGLRIDRQNNTVYLSSIFKWYGADFVGKHTPRTGFDGLNKTQRAGLNFCSGYLADRDRRYLAKGGYSVGYLDYDWTLNDRGETR